MTPTTFMLVLFLIFFIAILGSIMFTRRNDFDDVEETVVTTSTTTVVEGQERPVVGSLIRSWENGQCYVIDPVDHDRVWVNSSDDMYEDGAGRVWNLR